MSPVRWGVLSTGSIAREMVEAARRSGAARFVAVASRGADRARRFAGDLGLELAFASYQALLDCDGVDAVYVALPISMHAEWTVRARMTSAATARSAAAHTSISAATA
jgi:xylose dehydrogenase (NAD/NADP)